MVRRRFDLVARISTDSPATVEPVVRRLFSGGTVERGEAPGEFRVVASLEGESARDLNRSVLSELRHTERRTRIRSEWTDQGRVERFFDYVPTGRRKG